MKCRMLLTIGLLLAHGIAQPAGKEVALVTMLQGQVMRVGSSDGASRADQSQQGQLLQAYVMLKQGDQLALEKDSRLQLVYFSSGREEDWRGGGRLEITGTESHAFGLPEPHLRVLSAVLVKQLSRMPTNDGHGSAGAGRLRSIATPDSIAKIENTYRRLREESPDRSDLNPELYLLSGMFEMRELGRVEQVLADLQSERGGEQQVKMLVSLYKRAIRNSREAKGN